MAQLRAAARRLARLAPPRIRSRASLACDLAWLAVALQGCGHPLA